MFLLFYLLFPALSSIAIGNQRPRLYTYLLTALLVSIFPFAFLYLHDLINPPPAGPRCANPQFYLILSNFIIFLPLSMLLQWIVNILIRK